MKPPDALIRVADAADSWFRVTVIMILLVINGIWEELLIQGAEAMMLLRWSRDVVRYDLRWAVQEKARLLFKRGNIANQI